VHDVSRETKVAVYQAVVLTLFTVVKPGHSGGVA